MNITQQSEAAIYKNFNKTINVGIADMKYTSAPHHLRTNLGSCVALILYDKVKKSGGLVHIMLPKSFKDEIKPGKCADTAVPKIVEEMTGKRGSKKKDLVAKIFGGAKMLSNTSNDIGMKNTEEVIRLLKKHHIKIGTVKTGGTKGYLVQLDTSTGLVMCRIFGEEVEYF